VSVQPLRVMLSSRNVDEVPFSPDDKPVLSDLRKSLKAAIEGLQIARTKVFDVWINEDGVPAPGTENWWQHCLKQVETADIVIVLYTGKAGGTKTGGDLGICHAELEAAMRTGPARVRLVALPGPPSKKTDTRDGAFQDYVDQIGLFRGGTVNSSEMAGDRVLEALAEAVTALTRRGRSSARGDKYDRGPALEWNRLSFVERQRRMREALRDAMVSGHAGVDLGKEALKLPVHGTSVLFRLDAVPGAMSVAEARELLGRPHHADHSFEDSLKESKSFGPVHLIACHRSVTEAQALKVLGFPDAVTVASGFGVFIADNVQKAQLAFLRDCRDASSLRQSTQLFMDWLATSGESREVVERANGRKKIVRAVAGANREGAA
jgi:hypothetical protein